jgi:septum formation protein
MKIILGSSSPRRQKLLSGWGYTFDVLIPQIDEKTIRSEDLRTLPLKVASAKAESLRGQINQPATLITCDTIVLHNNELYEKPKDESDARRMLQSYGTGPAEVICGVFVTNTDTGKSAGGVDSAKVYFHKIPHPLIEEMIKHGRIFDFAGAFHPDDPPIKPYIVHIEGEMSTVMGLPKILTKKLINQVLNQEL